MQTLSQERTTSADASVLWVPSLPEQGWPSMDVYWKVIEGFRHRAEAMGFEVESMIEGAPDRSREVPGVLRALKKYVLYPREVAARGADIVHVLDLSYAHVLSRLRPGVKSVVTAFDIIPMLHEGTLTPSQLSRFTRCVKAARAADLVIAVSEQTKEDLITHLDIDRDRIVVAYPGTDFERFSKPLNGGAQIPGVSPGEKVILSLSSLDPKKNLLSLTEVLRPLASRFRAGEFRFVRAGMVLPDEWRNAFTQVIGEDAFTELGPTYGDDLVAAYQRADAFMMPSLFEGFSFTMMEAMAASCPVVSNRCSTNPEVGGEDGVLYYDEGSACQATAHLRRLFDDPSFSAQAVERGLARVHELTWENHWKVVEDCYLQLTESRG